MRRVYVAGLVCLLAGLTASAAWAQNQIGLGSSDDELQFIGTGSQTINTLWQTCGSSGCVFRGSASGTGSLQSSGSYVFTTPNNSPFTLVATSGGNFTVNQTATITFDYTSPQGTLDGTANFTSISETNTPNEPTLIGTLNVTGGTFASAFASGQGSFSINLAEASSLTTLVNNTGTIEGEIYFPALLTPPSPCAGTPSSIASNFNGTAIPANDYIWFNSNFSASGIQNGTVIQFQSSTIQFSAHGTQYTLTVPNATITFSSSANCASTSFDTATQTWQTTVPISGSDEIFLSGLAFEVPAGGFPGGINPVTWSGNFSSNTPGVSVSWKWGAAVYTSFSTDYNSLGVKAAHSNDCLYNNSDHAGTPENFKSSVKGGARGGGGSNFTGSWSGTASAKISCP